jgi:hypothetical protein
VKIEFSDGYVTILPPTKTKVSWRIEVWKRRQLPSGLIYHVMADRRRSLTDTGAEIKARELAEFWAGELPDSMVCRQQKGAISGTDKAANQIG